MKKVSLLVLLATVPARAEDWTGVALIFGATLLMYGACATLVGCLAGLFLISMLDRELGWRRVLAGLSVSTVLSALVGLGVLKFCNTDDRFSTGIILFLCVAGLASFLSLISLSRTAKRQPVPPLED